MANVGFLNRLLVVLVLLMTHAASHAQCANPVQAQCGVYESCFAKYCPCADGPTEYFKSYGAKYCRAFLANTALSEQGKKWRDSTLRCLQESIVPHLDISAQPKCDCAQMKQRAFDSHVACYTKQGASICELPAADVAQIGKTVEAKDLFDKQGWKQMHEVSKVCAVKSPDDGRRATWKVLEGVLRTRM